MHRDELDVEVQIGPRGRRARRQRRVRRLVRFAVAALVAIPLVGFLAARHPSPVDAEGPQAVRSTGGASAAVGLPANGEASSAGDPQLHSLRAVAPATTLAASAQPGDVEVAASVAPEAADENAAGDDPTDVAVVAENAAPDSVEATPEADAPSPATARPAASPAPTPAPPVTAPPTTAPPVTTPPTTAPPATAPPTTAPPTTVAPKPAAPAGTQRGQATWYRWKAGNCAHNTLPKGTVVTVTAVASGRTATCVVGDRGAFRVPTIIDLDATVFAKIAPLGAGRIEVSISW